MSQLNESSKVSIRARSLDGVSHRLVRFAAAHAPLTVAARLEEEWLADWAERATQTSRLRFALGCCWATRVIAVESRLSLVPADVALGANTATASRRDRWAYFSRRSLTLFLIVGLHVAVFYALMTWSHVRPMAVKPPLQNRPIDIPTPHPPPILIPEISKFTKVVTDFRHDDVTFPPIEKALPEKSDTVIDEGAPPDSPPQPREPPHIVARTAGGPGAGFPNPAEYYPELARVREEQGVASVRVCVNATGRLTSMPTLLEGSGSSRLDEGALKLATAGSGHYRASTEDGQPIASCYPIKIRFQLKN